FTSHAEGRKAPEDSPSVLVSNPSTRLRPEGISHEQVDPRLPDRPFAAQALPGRRRHPTRRSETASRSRETAYTILGASTTLWDRVSTSYATVITRTRTRTIPHSIAVRTTASSISKPGSPAPRRRRSTSASTREGPSSASGSDDRDETRPRPETERDRLAE